MRILTKCTVAAALVAATVLTAPITVAHADTGACISYLEDSGEDTTTRNVVCVETEVLGDAVSTEYALTTCVPLMSVTGLPEAKATKACTLAVQV